MTVEDLFDDLWASPIGRAFVCNFLDGLRWKIIRKDDASLFAHNWASILGATSGAALEYLDHAISSSGMTMRSQVTPASLPSAVATTTDARFITPYLRSSPTPGLNRIADLVDEYGHATTDRERYGIRNDIFVEVDAVSGGHKDGLIELELPTRIAGPKPYAWFTSYDDGDIEAGCWKHRGRWSDRADETRDVLGLIHRGSTTSSPPFRSPELVGTYVVPRSAIPAGTQFSRPSCLDAGEHSRFKCGFGNLAKRPYDWGRALHLARLLGGRPHRGGREIVMENFLPTGRIAFTILGEVMVPRMDFLSVHDDEFEVSVRRGRDEDSLRRRFIEAAR